MKKKKTGKKLTQKELKELTPTQLKKIAGGRRGDLRDEAGASVGGIRTK